MSLFLTYIFILSLHICSFTSLRGNWEFRCCLLELAIFRRHGTLTWIWWYGSKFIVEKILSKFNVMWGEDRHRNAFQDKLQTEALKVTALSWHNFASFALVMRFDLMELSILSGFKESIWWYFLVHWIFSALLQYLVVWYFSICSTIFTYKELLCRRHFSGSAFDKEQRKRRYYTRCTGFNITHKLMPRRFDPAF